MQTFEFRSDPFATRFMLANRRKLVNLHPAVIAQLNAFEAQAAASRASLPSPPRALPSPSRAGNADDATMERLMNRMEAARGPAARRAVVASAVGAFEQRHMYERFLLEAGRVEVNAVLEKVAALKSDAAKLRYLRECIDTLKSDPVPDALQERELAALDEEIARIESKKTG